MKLTKVTISPQSGEGTMHEVPRLRTKVRGVDEGTDKPRALKDIYSLGIRGRAPSWFLKLVQLSEPQGSGIESSSVREVGGRGGSLSAPTPQGVKGVIFVEAAPARSSG